MVKHSCENCGKEFRQKSHYEAHKNRKNPCGSLSETIQDLVSTTVKQNLQELNLVDQSSENINSENVENNTINIMIGDCMDEMKKIKNNTIDCIITSPPYWGMRDYKNDKQWGNEEKYEDYLNNMKVWCIECRRILKDSGSLFLNIGDKYSKKGLNLIPERTAIIFTDNGWCLRNNIIWYKPNHMPSSIKDRFCNTYEYVYFFVKDSGKYFNYDYYNNLDILRIKSETVEKHCDFPDTLNKEEYDEWLPKIKEHNDAKQNKYTGKFRGETINMGKSPGARASSGISYSLQRKHKLEKKNSLEINKFIAEWVTKSKKRTKDIDAHFEYKDTASHWVRIDPGRSIPKPEDWFKLKEFLGISDPKYDKMLTETHYVLQNVKNNPQGKNPGDLWNIPTEKCKESHYAVYPTELPRRILSAFCPQDGVVLDPFAGSGTTGVAAKMLGIRSILIDCNPEFTEIIKRRCNLI